MALQGQCFEMKVTVCYPDNLLLSIEFLSIYFIKYKITLILLISLNNSLITGNFIKILFMRGIRFGVTLNLEIKMEKLRTWVIFVFLFYP